MTQENNSGEVKAAVPTIVVVDDSSMIRATVKSYLKEFEGRINLAFAEDGYAAISTIAKLKPELVLADVLMPRLSGLQLCAMVKANPDTASTRVVMLTSKEGAVDMAAGRNSGADNYFVKPFTKEALRALICQEFPILSHEPA